MPPAKPAMAPGLRHTLRWAPAYVFLLGLVLTWQQHQAFERRESSARQARLELHAGELLAGIERRLSSNGVLLRGVAGLFASSEHVDREEFRTYVEGLDLTRHYPGIQGVGFAERVPAADLAAHTRRVRAEGYPGYAVHPPGERDPYSSIVYLEPFDWRNQRAFGFDMLSEPVRRVAMLRAADTGETAMTEMVTLVQETDTDRQAGFLIYVPLYRHGAPLDNAAQRREALLGWAYSPLRAHNLIDSFLEGEFRSLRRHIVLRLYAGGAASPDNLLYGPPPDPHPSAPAAYRVERQTINHGQPWLLELEPLPSYWSGDADDTPASRWVLWIGTLLSLLLSLIAHLQARHHLSVARLLDDAVRTNRLLADNTAALRLAGTVMEVSPIGIVVTDPDQRIVSVNPAFGRITGYTTQEVIGQRPSLLASGRQDQAFYRDMWLQIERTGFWEGELENRRKNGEVYPEMLSISRVRDEQGRTVSYVGMFQDITERRAADDRIRHLAHHDYLTGLPNRAFLVSQAAQELASARRYGRRLAMLFIDLDRFKPVNDTHGHEVGDAVLIEVARRLRALLRESDTVCRQGGDEFVVLLPEYRDADGLRELADKLCDALSAPYEIGELRLGLSASIGIATYPEHGDSVDTLIQSADAAMYRAKADPERRVALAQGPARR
jgi:diguanylate cyclase (GGDEF)-like protein/PAS domain S-box-containing protein